VIVQNLPETDIDREWCMKLKKAATGNVSDYCSFVLHQCPGKPLQNCIFSAFFDSKTDSKTGRQQWILVDFYGLWRGFLSLK
jgi:hypothetical protein